MTEMHEPTSGSKGTRNSAPHRLTSTAVANIRDELPPLPSNIVNGMRLASRLDLRRSIMVHADAMVYWCSSLEQMGQVPLHNVGVSRHRVKHSSEKSQRNVSALTNRSAGGNMIHRGSGFAPFCGKAFGFVATEVAQVAELADALDSGSSGRKVVEVRVLSWAPFIPQQLGRCCDSPR
jgi:hypothetical protein